MALAFTDLALLQAFGRPADVIAASKDLLELVLTPVIALVGAVTGFYFGEKSK